MHLTITDDDGEVAYSADLDDYDLLKQPARDMLIWDIGRTVRELKEQREEAASDG